MFETIGTLFTIVFWAIAIFLVGGGLLFCIDNLINGSGGRKLLTVIAIFLGIVAFIRIYAWCGSLVWSLILSGMVLAFVAEAGSGRLKDAPQKKKEPGIISTVTNEILEKKALEETIENAIRKSKE